MDVETVVRNVMDCQVCKETASLYSVTNNLLTVPTLIYKCSGCGVKYFKSLHEMKVEDKEVRDE